MRRGVNSPESFPVREKRWISRRKEVSRVSGGLRWQQKGLEKTLLDAVLTMTKQKRLIFLGVLGSLGLLFAGALRSYILSVTNPKPWKIGSVSVPDSQLTISLWAGSKQEALIQPYDGVYRILEISQRDKPPAYYDIPSTITSDGCRMEVFWYPTNRFIRFKDTKFAEFSREFRSECLLDLNENVMFAVIRLHGVTHVAKLSEARADLVFPKTHNEERVPHLYGVGTSTEKSNLSEAVTVTETITIGEQEAKPIDAQWTSDSGVLVGVIEPHE
jgi:hypothetical protein